MKTIFLALAVFFLSVSAAQAAPASRCECNGCGERSWGWLTGDQTLWPKCRFRGACQAHAVCTGVCFNCDADATGKECGSAADRHDARAQCDLKLRDRIRTANKLPRCALYAALYEFGVKKFGVSPGRAPELLSVSRKSYAQYSVKKAGKERNLYSKEVEQFLRAVARDGTRTPEERRFDVAKLTAGFYALADDGKIPNDVSFHFDTGRGLPVLNSSLRTEYKFSSLESSASKPARPQCFNGIDVTGLSLGGALSDCSASAAAP